MPIQFRNLAHDWLQRESESMDNHFRPITFTVHDIIGCGHLLSAIKKTDQIYILDLQATGHEVLRKKIDSYMNTEHKLGQVTLH